MDEGPVTFFYCKCLHAYMIVIQLATNTSTSFISTCVRGSRKFCQKGSNFDNVFVFVFFVDEG